jgi:hypothetical protein
MHNPRFFQDPREHGVFAKTIAILKVDAAVAFGEQENEAIPAPC